MLHKGHLNLLRKMRKEADTLIVLIHDDKSCYEIKDKFPVQDLQHRIKNLELTALPDHVFYTDSADPSEIFEKVVKNFGGNLYMRGDDLKEDFPGKKKLDELKIPIKFEPYTRGVSSSEMREKL